MSGPLGFARHAETYDAHARVQHAFAADLLGRCRELGELHGPVLDLGCGTGWLIAELSAQSPDTKLIGVDLSEDMLRIARERSDAVTWICADMRQLRLATPCALVLSSSALHWVDPLDAAMAAAAHALMPGGALECVLMIEGTLTELHQSRRAAVPSLPPGRALPEEASVLRALQDAGFEVSHAHVLEHQEQFESPRAALRALHQQGVTGGDLSHGARLLTRRELAALEAHYADHFSEPDGRVRATYRGLAVSAVKA